jgi:hypothetical protein
MNLFSSDVYLNAVADIYFPGRARAVEIFRTGGKYFRLLVLDNREVITTWPFLDYVEPLEEPPGEVSKELAYIPNAVLEIVPADGRPVAGGKADVEPAPFIHWGQFSDWSGFEARVASRRKNLKRESLRKQRGLQNTFGALSIVLSDPRPEVFDQCIQWKSAQYVRTGLRNMFANPDHVRFFRELHRKELVIVSSISAGGRLLAVHFGALADRAFYSWVAAYDPQHSTYSPGALLLEALLFESWRRKDVEFNFLIGDQEYKWFYATHNRVIGPLGSAPLTVRLAKAAKRPVRKLLSNSPQLLLLARKLMRRLER